MNYHINAYVLYKLYYLIVCSVECPVELMSVCLIKVRISCFCNLLSSYPCAFPPFCAFVPMKYQISYIVYFTVNNLTKFNIRLNLQKYIFWDLTSTLYQHFSYCLLIYKHNGLDSLHSISSHFLKLVHQIPGFSCGNVMLFQLILIFFCNNDFLILYSCLCFSLVLLFCTVPNHFIQCLNYRTYSDSRAHSAWCSSTCPKKAILLG